MEWDDGSVFSGQHCRYFHKEKNKKGFTLTEIAIVLGIIGLILGAIWVAASTVYINMKVSKALTEVAQINQAIRTLYQNQPLTDSAPGLDETPALIAAKIFPSDMISPDNTTVLAPWAGSTLTVLSAQGNVEYASNAPDFVLNFVNLPKSACIALLMAATGPSRDPGLIQFYTSLASSPTSGLLLYTSYQFPLTLNEAAADCPSEGMDIFFTFLMAP